LQITLPSQRLAFRIQRKLKIQEEEKTTQEINEEKL
jgi:hypothetical protein